MNFELDSTSFLVTCDVDERLDVLEKDLRQKGLTLGYAPLTDTLRHALEQRIPNENAWRYGEIDDICASLQAVREGKTIVTKNVPRAATGPDFKKLLIGSGRRYADLVRATLKVHPLPEARESLTATWKDKKRRDDFLKKFWASGIRPSRFQASAEEIAVTLEGDKKMVAAERKCFERLVRQTQGEKA